MLKPSRFSLGTVSPQDYRLYVMSWENPGGRDPGEKDIPFWGTAKLHREGEMLHTRVRAECASI